MYQSIFTLVLRLLLAELKFLKEALEKVMKQDEGQKLRLRVGELIKHHAKVIA